MLKRTTAGVRQMSFSWGSVQQSRFLAVKEVQSPELALNPWMSASHQPLSYETVRDRSDKASAVTEYDNDDHHVEHGLANAAVI
jgi:hypothetical protein